MIDESLLNIVDTMPPSKGLIRYNQATSSQSIRAIVTLAFTGTVVALVALGRPVPDTVASILLISLGFYFGELVPTKATPPPSD